MKKFCRSFVILSIFAALFLMNSHAEDGRTVMKYLCNGGDGAKRWDASSVIAPQKEKGMYTFTEEGSGVYYGFDVPVKWKAETEFSDDGVNIVPIRSRKVITSDTGKALFEGTQEFDHENNKVTCVKKWLDTGKEVSKVLKFKGEIVNDLLMGTYVKRFLKAGDREKTFYLVTNDPEVYKIKAAVKSEEEITVNGQTLSAYKISLDPDIGMFGAFAPKTYVWHRAGGNFEWLKYQGAEDTIDSPEVVMETLDKI